MAKTGEILRNTLKIIPLGGLGEIGLNMMVIEFEDHTIVVDAGLMFPDSFMPGVDVVIPNFNYIKESGRRLDAIIITHGHEDHIGAMPYLLKLYNVPVYGTKFTLALLAEKLKEHDLNEIDLRTVSPGDVSIIGPFNIEYIRVSHSVVDGVALAIRTPEGVIIHSGDFKIDTTPIDGFMTDLQRFGSYGAEGVLAFLSDSTNVEREGFSISEREVCNTIKELFRDAEGRLIIAAFSSNISRINQIIKLAQETGRKICLSGKSMITNVKLAEEHSFISMPAGLEVNIKDISTYPDNKIVIITTGSQGEPMSSLSRIAKGQHKAVKIKQGDTIVLSSRFIPGNEKAITSLINDMCKLGANVIYEKVSDIHTSGHAHREELKIMLNLVKPEYFIPIHGEYRHLMHHANLAVTCGIDKKKVIIAENGDVISFRSKAGSITEQVEVGKVLVDGKGVGDIEEQVLRDRRRLSGHGMVVIFIVIDLESGYILHGPEIVSRGFVLQENGGHILEDAKSIILEILDEYNTVADDETIKLLIQKRLKVFFYDTLERSPMILPVIMKV